MPRPGSGRELPECIPRRSRPPRQRSRRRSRKRAGPAAKGAAHRRCVRLPPRRRSLEWPSLVQRAALHANGGDEPHPCTHKLPRDRSSPPAFGRHGAPTNRRASLPECRVGPRQRGTILEPSGKIYITHLSAPSEFPDATRNVFLPSLFLFRRLAKTRPGDRPGGQVRARMAGALGSPLS